MTISQDAERNAYYTELGLQAAYRVIAAAVADLRAQVDSVRGYARSCDAAAAEYRARAEAANARHDYAERDRLNVKANAADDDYISFITRAQRLERKLAQAEEMAKNAN